MNTNRKENLLNLVELASLADACRLALETDGPEAKVNALNLVANKLESMVTTEKMAGLFPDNETLFPPVSPGNATNMNTMVKAAADGNLGLLTAFDTKTGEFVDTLCAFCPDGKEVAIIPFAIFDKSMTLYSRLMIQPTAPTIQPLDTNTTKH